MSRIIVTGATGYLGKVLINKLYEEHYEIVALGMKGENNPFSFLDNNHYYNIDIRDPHPLINIVQNDDIVIHLAALISIANNDNKRLYDINYLGTKNVYQDAQTNHAKHFIYMSTTDILYKKTGLIDENIFFNAPNKKMSGYEKSKYLASKYVYEHKDNNMKVSLIFPSGIIGPDDDKIGKVSLLLKQIYENKLKCYVKGGYAFIDVRDIVDAIMIIIKNNQEKLYIASSGYMSIKEITKLVESLSPNKAHAICLPTFLAYIGLPFVSLDSKIRHVEALYTSVALKTIRRNPNFTSSLLINDLSRPLIKPEQSIVDEIRYMEQHQLLKINKRKEKRLLNKDNSLN